MKTVKKHKRKIIIASIIAGIIAVLACAAVYIHVLSSPRPTVKQDPSPVDNAYRNRTANINAEAVGENGKLLFNAYNHFPFSGIYQVEGGVLRRVYRGELNILGANNPFSDYLYNGNLIDYGETALRRLNLSTGQFEPFLYPDLEEGKAIADAFTAGGELYFSVGAKELYYAHDPEDNDDAAAAPSGETVDDAVTIYHYTDNGAVETAASEKLCGKGFVPYDFCGNIMYYYLKDETRSDTPVPNDFRAEIYSCNIRKLYAYNLAERKTERCIDFSVIDSVLPEKNCAFDGLLVTDNKVYLFVRIPEKLEAHYNAEAIRNDPYRLEVGYAERLFVYRYDIASGKLDAPVEVGDSSPFAVNGYGDKVYVQAATEHHYGNVTQYKNTLYAFSDSAAEPTVLHINSPATGLYIFDEDHLYYTTADNRLHRIRPDDTGNESVF